MAQVVANARRKTLPLVVLHEHGSRQDGDLVVCRLSDLEKWLLDSADLMAIRAARKAGVTRNGKRA